MNMMAHLPLQNQDQSIAFSFWAKEFSHDELLVTAFSVDEAIFGMTRVEVMLSSKKHDIDLESLMDNAATLTVHHKYLADLRHFSGIVVEAERGDRGHHRTAYRVVLMPELHRLDHGSDCRIFQQQSVPDIIKTIFSEHGIQDVKWILKQDHQQREYTVAYRETHLAFVERIMAEEGIFYYFEHDKEGLHKLVLSDMPQVLHDCPGQKELQYNAFATSSVDEVYCSTLNFRKKLRSTTFVQRDYTFKNPEYNQQHKSQASNLAGEKHDYEMYAYPGRYKGSKAGEPFTRYKLEATRVDASIAYGIANTPLLLSGHGMTLNEHPDKELNRKWRLLTVRHEGVQPQAFGEDAQGAPLGSTPFAASGLAGATLAGLSFGTTSSQSPGVLHSVLNRGLNLAMQRGQNTDGAAETACLYACAFTAQSSDLPYRPPQMTKPLIDGPQVAIVVGPPNEEIYTDEYGRVKVHFPWDRHNDPDAESSSCWIRVSQAWGGGDFGNMAIPRVGHEVIVEFLEGDPDQPIIMGRTYHETNKTPYKLPEHKTKMAIRSGTHKGDGGFNELSFEDESGQENMFMHAEKDQTIKVKNNQTQRIDANASQSIGANQAIEVGNNVNHQVGGGMNMVVGAVGSQASQLTGGALGERMAEASKMLQEGINIAIQAISEKASADLPVTTGSALLSNAVPADAAGIASQATQFATLLDQGGVMSVLGQMASAFDAARKGINETPRYDLRTEGGKHMASSGGKMTENVGALVGGGVLNQVVSKFQSVSTGIAVSEQIGSMKISSIGHAYIEKIGHTKDVEIKKDEKRIVNNNQNITVGQEHNLAVGQEYKLNIGAAQVTITANASGQLMINTTSDITIGSGGDIRLTGKNILLEADHIGLNDSKPE